MFVSFFPRPLVFILSAILWGILAVRLWYAFGTQLGALSGFQFPVSGEKIMGATIFWSSQSLWFYLYFAAATALFASAWMVLSPHRWSRWSILGSALILFTSYFQVQVSVAINGWYGPFYDLVQAALSKSAPVTLFQFYTQLASFAEIALVAVTVGVLTKFFNHRNPQSFSETSNFGAHVIADPHLLKSSTSISVSNNLAMISTILRRPSVSALMGISLTTCPCTFVRATILVVPSVSLK
jgi:ABC-type long-subunit fatty acid transport system fused permease/ATPase subunit